MWRAALRSLAAHKRRLFTTGLAVMLGVAFMAGTMVLADTVTKTFDSLFADVYRNTDSVVRAKASFEDPNGFADQRGRVDAALVATVAAVEGVDVAQGDIFGYAQIIGPDGDPLGNPEFGAPTIGGNWNNSPELNPWRFADGREPIADNEAVIDKKSADDTGYGVGDTIPVLVKGGPTPVKVVGVVRFGTADSPGGASFVLFTTAAAQRLVAEPGRFDSISVLGEHGLSQEEVTRKVAAVLSGDVEAVTGAAITAETQDAIHRGLSFFNTFMMIFAVVALLVGGFMIFNTFSITVAQRTREHALLRAIGGSRRQILASVMLEAVGLGLAASVVGLAAGVAVAGGLKAMLAGFGMEIPAGGVVFTESTAVVSLLAGISVTVAAAFFPARRAGRVAPMAALRQGSADGGDGRSRARVISGAGVLGLGGLGLFYGLFGDSDQALAVVGAGALAVFFGVSILGPVVALPLSRAIGAPLPRLRGVTGRLARENAMRNPKRTAATASALMIGVGLVGFITIFASSTKASFNHTIDKVFTGDFVITGSAGFGAGGLDPSLAEQAAELPELAAVAPVRGAFVEVDGSPTEIIAASLGSTDLIDVGPIEGAPADLGVDGIGVHEDKAREKGLRLGDTVPVVFKDTGRQLMKVAMIYREQQPAGNWLLGLPAFEANFDDQFDLQVFVAKAPGATVDEARSALQAVTDAYPGANLLDQAAYKEDQTKFVDQMLGLVYAMLALAIIIALLGIGNTLALSILERTRELGVMRAVGMTRAQLRSAIRWESVIIALQGTLLGLGVGIFFGWALMEALADEGLEVFSVPFRSLGVIVVLAALAGVTAAILPARRAARLNVLQAVVSE